MKLRPYQSECLAAILQGFREHTSALAVLATGLGKTVILSAVAGKCVQKGKRVLVIAHREELIYQSAAKLEAVTGAKVDIEMGELKALDTLHGKAPIVVASVQTLNARRGDARRMKFFDPKEFGLIVTDECHHGTAASYMEIERYFREGNPTIKHLGMTATPDRGDGEALKKVYQACVYQYDVDHAIRDGWLVDVQQQTVRVDGLDYSNIHTQAGDLNASELAAVMEYEGNLQGIAGATRSIVGDRKTLVFAASVAHAERLAEIFNRHKPGSARIVTGKTPKEERRELLRSYAAREFQYLCNVGVATEGFDDPGIEVVVMGRLTKSRALYAQMLGRGTRPVPGTIDGPHTELWEAPQRVQAIKASAKPSVLVLDFVGNAGKHKLITARDVLGGKMNEKIAKRVAKKQERGDKPSSVLEDIADAEREEREEAKRREAAARRRIKGEAKYSTQKVSPFDVLGVLPEREQPWNLCRTPSKKMVAYLQRSGVPNPELLTWQQAGTLIASINKRFELGLCSYKQAKFLSRYGYDATGMKREMASTLIDAIVANGYRALNQEASA